MKFRFVLLAALFSYLSVGGSPLRAEGLWDGFVNSLRSSDEDRSYQEIYEEGVRGSLDPSWKGSLEEIVQRSGGYVLRMPMVLTLVKEGTMAHMPVPMAMEALDGNNPREYALYLQNYLRVRWDKITVEEAIFLTKRYNLDKLTPIEQDRSLALYGENVRNYLTGLGARVVASHIDDADQRGQFVNGFLRNRIQELGRTHSLPTAEGTERGVPSRLLPGATEGRVPEKARDLTPEDLTALLRETTWAHRGTLVQEYFDNAGANLSQQEAQEVVAATTNDPSEREMLLKHWYWSHSQKAPQPEWKTRYDINQAWLQARLAYRDARGQPYDIWGQPLPYK